MCQKCVYVCVVCGCAVGVARVRAAERVIQQLHLICESAAVAVVVAELKEVITTAEQLLHPQHHKLYNAYKTLLHLQLQLLHRSQTHERNPTTATTAVVVEDLLECYRKAIACAESVVMPTYSLEAAMIHYQLAQSLTTTTTATTTAATIMQVALVHTSVCLGASHSLVQLIQQKLDRLTTAIA